MTFRSLVPAVAVVALAACGDNSVAPGSNDIPIDTGSTQPPATSTGALSLTSGAPGELVAGGTASISGSGFSSTPSQNTVTLGGVPLTVTAATATALTVAIPGDRYACGAAQTLPLTVAARGESATRTITLRTARAHALAPGASVVLGDGERCVELPTAGDRYVVSVVNASRSVGSVAPFEVVGSTAGSSTVNAAPVVEGTLASPASATWSGDRQGRATQTVRDDAKRGRERLHHRVLETSRGLRARLGRPGREATVQARLSASPTTTQVATVAAGPTTTLQTAGDTATLRIPDINSSNACAKYFAVKTRVVYSGARAIILEDAASPLAGQMDATYRAIGTEFDNVMWPVLTANFGNPLAMDARLDRNGKIIMLFSPVVNNNFAGIAGFVIGCDFYSRAQAPSSNEGEVFYATVPTSLSGGLTSNASRDGWLRTMRSTIIHEAKHITAYAERMSRGHDIEDAWLEEGAARHSEELYARALTNGAWKDNAGYASIACEVRPTTSGCADRPYVMYKHFDGLVDYLGANGSLSPLGQTSSSDYNYYASAWSLIRWAADLAPSEAAFFQALTKGPATGVANLEAATGRSWPEIVADWTMSLALDDHAGFAPSRSQRIASWNLQDVFAGMNRDFPGAYTRAHPLAANAATFGGFRVQGNGLRGGSASVIDLTGSWAGPQVLELRAPGGGAPSSTLRLAVTRVK